MEEQIEQAVLCALSPQVDPNMKAQVKNDRWIACPYATLDHAWIYWIGMVEAHETM